MREARGLRRFTGAFLSYLATGALSPEQGRRYSPGVQTFGEQLTTSPSLQQVLVPDLWQQAAVSALRAGHDAVVHARLVPARR
jgi:hypothetical protein